MREARRFFVLAAAVIGVCLSQLAGATAPAAAQAGAPTPLAGAVTAADGEPMPGVAVSARAEGSSVTTSVFTDEAGRYYFPALEPPLAGGPYQVWAQAVGYERANANVVLDPARRSSRDFTLAAAADFTHQLSGVEWLDALPAATREDRRLKELFRVTCTECHQAGLVLQNRFDERGWRAMIDLMANVSYHGWRGSNGRPSITIEYYRDELAAYLTKARGPESAPLTFDLQPRPTGEAARHVVTEYDIPIAELPTERTSIDGSDWSEGIPSGMRGGGGMHDAAVDDDGNVWITDSVPNDFRTLARLDPRTGRITGFKVTAPDGRRARRSHGIIKARDGMMWFDTQGSLGRVDPKTEAFELYTPPRPLGVGGSLQEDGLGNIWVGNRHGALKFDPATREFTYFQNKTIGDGQTYGTAADRLGNGWWAQFNMDIVGHANGTTGEVNEVPMRPPGALDREQLLTPADRDFFHRIGAMRFSGSVYNPGGQAPRRLAADPAGDTVWVANWWGSNLARIDINTLEATYYHLPVGAHPYATVVDRNHMVWTNLSSDDAVARFDPGTEEYTIFRLPSLGAELRHIAVDDAGGPDVWVVYREASRAARIQFRTEAQLQSARAASALAAAAGGGQ
ncbi:MAG: carboxypeptidase regulatory-like domain-containing protein [Acidobacteria bacterium]|nr:carboxypeptidase regulatory-like domain-containing protein [Acidobacteriota bacterium]